MAAPLATDPQDILMAIGPTGRMDVVVDPRLGIQLVAGEQAVVQAIQFRLQLQFGEWFLNQEIGVRWYEEILGDASKTPGVEARARAAVAAVILEVPAVTSILHLDVSLDAVSRTLTITFALQCTFGTTAVTTLTVGGNA